MTELEMALKFLVKALAKLRKNPPQTSNRLWATYVRSVSMLAGVVQTVGFLDTIVRKAYEGK